MRFRNNLKMPLWLLLALPVCLANTVSQSQSHDVHPHVDTKHPVTTHHIESLVKEIHLGHETDEKHTKGHLIPVIHAGHSASHGSNALEPKKGSNVLGPKQGKTKLTTQERLKLKRKRKQWRLKKKQEKLRRKKQRKAKKGLKKAAKKQTKALTKSVKGGLKKRPRMVKINGRRKALRRKLLRALRIKGRKKGKKGKGGLRKLKSRRKGLKKGQLRSGGLRFRGRQRITVNRGRPVKHEVNDHLAADGKTHTYKTKGYNGRVRSKMHVTVDRKRNKGSRRYGRRQPRRRGKKRN